MWVLHYRPDNVSQAWSILNSYDNRLSAIIKAYQISSEYFMIKVIDPDVAASSGVIKRIFAIHLDCVKTKNIFSL